MTETSLTLDLRQVVFVLSDALDYVGVDDWQHGKRVAFMAVKTAEAAGFDADFLDDLFHAALIHDCGVSSTREHRKLVDELDWAGDDAHCRRGFELLQAFPPLAGLAPAVRYHHRHWQDLPAIAPRDRQLANCIYLVDRVDALLAQEGVPAPVLAREDIRQAVAANRGSRFAPDLADGFQKASEAEAFWFTLEPTSLETYLEGMMRERRPQSLDLEALTGLARVFARIVDAKSPFTAEHSEGVARVARLLGERRGLPADRCRMLEVAGLLHDLGKLRIPDAILDKPAPLDASERATIHHHSFHTYQLLGRIEGLQEIAEWAAFHHEELSGQGYPFQYGRFELGVEARLVAVADVFQALAQDRPYRGPMALDAILAELRRMAADDKLDADLVELAAANGEDCLAAALGRE